MDAPMKINATLVVSLLLPSISNTIRANQHTALDDLKLDEYVSNLDKQAPTQVDIPAILESTTIANNDVAREYVKKLYAELKGLYEPSPEIQAIAEETLRNSCINIPVIILEKNDSSDTEAYVKQFSDYAFMVIESLHSHTMREHNSRIFAAYHECGHIYHNHYRQIKDLLYGPLLKSAIAFLNRPILLSALNPISLMIAWTLAKQTQTHNPLVERMQPTTRAVFRVGENLGLGALIVYAAIKTGQFVFSDLFDKMHGRYPEYIRAMMLVHEKEADLFACNQLARIGRDDIILEEIHVYKVPDDHHPSYTERAEYLGAFLKKFSTSGNECTDKCQPKRSSSQPEASTF